MGCNYLQPMHLAQRLILRCSGEANHPANNAASQCQNFRPYPRGYLGSARRAPVGGQSKHHAACHTHQHSLTHSLDDIGLTRSYVLQSIPTVRPKLFAAAASDGHGGSRKRRGQPNFCDRRKVRLFCKFPRGLRGFTSIV